MMMKRILVIDNYDSFTYNLVQCLGILGAECEVVLNDALSVQEIAERGVDGILISPGPATPDSAGVSMATVRALSGKLPILGVCLGHQSIAQVFGGKVVRAGRFMHGRTSLIHHDRRGLFSGLEEPFLATRYHSLIVEPASLPMALEVSAWTEEGEIMGLRHRSFDTDGVQFHPESILTEAGLALLGNWLNAPRRVAAAGAVAKKRVEAISCA
jgi:anthranilate synthase/aminodeoxychorismate synthase-like glutamine amidotransferase